MDRHREPQLERAGILSADTSATAERMQVERWQSMSVRDKARLISELTRATQQLALAGIRQRHHGASERECFLRLAALKLGRDTVMRVYADAQDLLGT